MHYGGMFMNKNILDPVPNSNLVSNGNTNIPKRVKISIVTKITKLRAL